MTRKKYLIILFFTILISSFDTTTAQNGSAYLPTDTSTSFKIGNYWVTPKTSFDFNSLGNSSGDTLHLVTCSNYVYFPFGKLTDKSSIATSLLKDFTITSFKRDTFTNTDMIPPFFEWSESVDIRLADNKLNLFLDNDPEATMHGYIQGGQIVDGKVVFSNNIKVGMRMKDFYAKFFDYFPIELVEKYKVVKLESCVMDVTHIYTFINGQLSAVNFRTE